MFKQKKKSDRVIGDYLWASPKFNLHGQSEVFQSQFRGIFYWNHNLDIQNHLVIHFIQRYYVTRPLCSTVILKQAKTEDIQALPCSQTGK